MKRIISQVFIAFLKLTKGWPFRNKYSGKVQILMFHRVVSSIGSNRINNDGIEVTDDYLVFLIEFYLKNSFIPISINDVKKVVNEQSNKRYVVFTFDDGYADNYEKALPIFEKYNIPFAIYIPINLINRKQFAWWYFIEDIIRDNAEIIYLDSGVEKRASIENKISKHSFFVELRKIIQANKETLDALVERYKPNLNLYHDLFLNSEQLNLMANHRLVTIGSHSITHPSLAKITNQESFDEINNSKFELEKIIQKEVLHFSYPFGTINDVGEREIKNAETAGYSTAVTTSYGDVYSNKSNLFALPRIWTSNNIKGVELFKIIFGINARSMKK